MGGSGSRKTGISVAALMAVAGFGGAVQAEEMRSSHQAAYINDFAVLSPAAQAVGAIDQFEADGASLTEGLMNSQEILGSVVNQVKGSTIGEAQKAVNIHIDRQKEIGANQVKNGEWTLEGLEAVSNYIIEQHADIHSARMGARSDMIDMNVENMQAQTVSVEMMAFAVQPNKQDTSKDILASTGLDDDALSGLSKYQSSMEEAVSNLKNVGPELQATLLVQQPELRGPVDATMREPVATYEVFDLEANGSDLDLDNLDPDPYLRMKEQIQDSELPAETKGELAKASIEGTLNEMHGEGVQASDGDDDGRVTMDRRRHEAQSENASREVTPEREQQAVAVSDNTQAVSVDRDEQAISFDREMKAATVSDNAQAVSVDRDKQAISFDRKRQAIILKDNRKEVSFSLKSLKIVSPEMAQQRVSMLRKKVAIASAGIDGDLPSSGAENNTSESKEDRRKRIVSEAAAREARENSKGVQVKPGLRQSGPELE